MVKWLRQRIPHRLTQEDGAVTVDWVVLTGFVIALCLALVALMNDAFTTGGTTIKSSMSATP
jgi:hypothetical protein